MKHIGLYLIGAFILTAAIAVSSGVKHGTVVEVQALPLHGGVMVTLDDGKLWHCKCEKARVGDEGWFTNCKGYTYK